METPSTVEFVVYNNLNVFWIHPITTDKSFLCCPSFCIFFDIAIVHYAKLVGRTWKIDDEGILKNSQIQTQDRAFFILSEQNRFQ